jgi:DNA-binding MarR family transcriptional regulator
MRESRKRANGVAAATMREAAGYVLPPTVSRDVLLENGSDRRFRSLVADLFTISARMEIVRGRLGSKLGITGPQYSLIVAIARLQGSGGVSVGAVAQALHVSSAFVATETGKLVRRRFLAKRTNPLDRRGVLLSIAPAGRLKLDSISHDIRAINDLFFGELDAKSFAALSSGAAALVSGSSRAIRRLTGTGKLASAKNDWVREHEGLLQE